MPEVSVGSNGLAAAAPQKLIATTGWKGARTRVVGGGIHAAGIAGLFLDRVHLGQAHLRIAVLAELVASVVLRAGIHFAVRAMR